MNQSVTIEGIDDLIASLEADYAEFKEFAVNPAASSIVYTCGTTVSGF